MTTAYGKPTAFLKPITRFQESECDDLASRLRDVARGVEVRVLYANPDYRAIRAIGAEEIHYVSDHVGIGAGLAHDTVLEQWAKERWTDKSVGRLNRGRPAAPVRIRCYKRIPVFMRTIWIGEEGAFEE